jgi:hypothetical protein
VRDLFGVPSESALRGNELAAFAAGVSNRPASGAFQVVRVCALGHAEVHQKGTNSVRTEEQIAARKAVVLIWVHRETPVIFRDEK